MLKILFGIAQWNIQMQSARTWSFISNASQHKWLNLINQDACTDPYFQATNLMVSSSSSQINTVVKKPLQKPDARCHVFHTPLAFSVQILLLNLNITLQYLQTVKIM